MGRGTGLFLATLALALPVTAQSHDPRLHRFIPGDLPLGALPAGVLVAPQGTEDFRRVAGATGWDDRDTQGPSREVLRPQGTWESIARAMDDQTRSPPGTTLRYREVFTPSVAPFKRTHAYDAVDDLGRLVLRDPSLRPVLVGELPPAWSQEPQARFTGDVMIEFAAHAPTIVPSVAGEQAIVSFRTEPEVPLAFFQDSAGNLYARAPEPRTVRLVYVLAAPQHAFAVPGARLPSMSPGGTSFHGVAPRPVVPSFLEGAVESVLRRVGVQRSDPFPRVLDALVGYFRAFRDDDLADTSDRALYTRLALGGVGACRHRTYAFVLTLHALGVPARYVGNEAHAWAEVAIPGVGWSRIDLGGWDVNFLDESEPRERFVPDHPDPFQRPAGYRNGYSSQGATGNALRPREAGRLESDASTTSSTPSPSSSHGAPSDPSRTALGTPRNLSGNATTGGISDDAATARPSHAARSVSHAPSLDPLDVPRALERGVSQGEEPSIPERHRTVLRLLSVRPSDGAATGALVRGTIVFCEGEARDELGAPVADLPITLELSRHGRALTVLRNGRRDTALGTTVTDADGRFQARVLLPLELEAGTYSIRAHTLGDARHLPASVE